MYQFDKDISLKQQDAISFTGTISENWLINGNSNGGYLMALMANSILHRGETKSISILSATFISRCVPGDADLWVENISPSNNLKRWMVRLSQNKMEKVIGIGTSINNENGPGEKKYEKSAPEIRDIGECVAIPERAGYTLFGGVDVLLDPDSAGWMDGQLTDRSELKGWIRFKDDRPFDDLSILLAIDSLPPPVFSSHGSFAWVPTLEMSVNIRNSPKGRWLKAVFVSRFINNGIVEEDGELWDEDGELIAISRQISQFRKK